MTGLNNFIPEIWSANILVTLENSLVFANLANREHEGEIKAYGDTVHITGIGDIQIQDYTKYGKLTIQPVTDIDAGVLKIDQSKAFAFEVDDLDTVQAREANARSAPHTILRLKLISMLADLWLLPPQVRL